MLATLAWKQDDVKWECPHNWLIDNSASFSPSALILWNDGKVWSVLADSFFFPFPLGVAWSFLPVMGAFLTELYLLQVTVFYIYAKLFWSIFVARPLSLFCYLLIHIWLHCLAFLKAFCHCFHCLNCAALLVIVMNPISSSFGDMLSFTLTAFVELMDHGIVSWDTFSVAFIKKVNLYLRMCQFNVQFICRF